MTSNRALDQEINGIKVLGAEHRLRSLEALPMFLRNSSLVLLVASIAVLPDSLAETDRVEEFLQKIDQLSDYEPGIVDKESLMPAMESLRKSEGLEAALLLW